MLPSTVRQVIETRVGLLSGTYTGWTVSQEPYAFVRAPERSPVHLEFAVDLIDSEPLSPVQRTAEGVPTKHTCKVLFAYHLPDKDKVAGHAAMLDIEQAIRVQLVATGWTYDGTQTPTTVFSSLMWTGSTHSPGIYGWEYSESTFTLLQPLPLT